MFKSKKIFSLEEVSDESLLKQYQLSEHLNSYTQLYQRYAALIYGVCLKYVEKEMAKDICMDLFEILQNKIKKQDIQNFKSWLYMVVKNHCLMQLRTLKKEENILFSKDFMEMESDLHPSWKEHEFNLVGLERCIAELNEFQRIAIELFYIQEKCYQEIASETGYALMQVKSYIQNGKRNLKICIERYRETEVNR